MIWSEIETLSMYPKLSLSFFLFLAIVFACLELSTPMKFLKDDSKFKACSQRFSCGGVRNVGYPFWGGVRTQDCGRPEFKLECNKDINPEIEIMLVKFAVLDIYERDPILTVVPLDMLDDGCPGRVAKTTIGNSPFECASSNAMLTYMYNCTPGIPNWVPAEFRCTGYEPVYGGYYNVRQSNFLEGSQPCQSRINIPLLQKNYLDLQGFLPPKEALKRGFGLRYKDDAQEDCLKCVESDGRCGYDTTSKEFLCFMSGNPGHLAVQVAIASTVAGLGVLLVTLCCLSKKLSNFFWRRHKKTHQNVEAFLRNYGPLQVRRYRYSDIKKMTNSFTEKLGQGGFGDVYKGKLDDGCLVAVKVLNNTKGSNAEEFINEVATISRTSHVNIVSLLGFCFASAKKRALIFEFMPNGSLEKFIFDENSSESNPHQLDWKTHYQISLGIARGLEYLHRGCNTRILHFDIKPQNILLDAEFVPKISDFGLAKICTRKESIVSMMGPRGTIGYIAPEVYCRNFGGVSYKSDVYSYGMMVLEMVGGRKNINVRVDNTSEIYFPHWIYRRLEIDEDLGMKRIMNEEDRVKVRKMIIVSLWCIQTDPSTRPTMSRVIEMLEGSLDSLQVPPKPFLSSPPRSPPPASSSTSGSEQI